MSGIIAVQLDELEALATELAALGAQLADRESICRGVISTPVDALGGSEGDAASDVAAAWASLLGLLSDRTGAAAGALVSAVAAYRAADAAMADRFCPADPDYAPPGS